MNFVFVLKNILFTEHLRATASNNNFIGRKMSTFRTKILIINTGNNGFDSQKADIYLIFLIIEKNNSNGTFLLSYKLDIMI